MNILETRDLSFRYRGAGEDVLSGITLSVDAGASLGIVGESGAGKSTVLAQLLGLQRPRGGEVLFDGEPLRLGSRAARARFRGAVQPVFQDPYSSLDPRMTIGDSVAEPLVSLGITPTRREALARVPALLESVGLDADAAGRYPAAFSGGQRQRIAIARALAPEPRVLLADEPVSALDVSVRMQVIELLRSLATERGLALVLVSHDLTIVSALCENIAVLRAGRVVEQGSTAEVLRRPREPYTRELLGSVPRLPS